MSEMTDCNDLRIAAHLVLDCADYTVGNCRVNEMVGAVLPPEILARLRSALEESTQPKGKK